jgi:hypothetical protein
VSNSVQETLLSTVPAPPVYTNEQSQSNVIDKHVHDVECEEQFGGAFIAFGTLVGAVVMGGLIG